MDLIQKTNEASINKADHHAALSPHELLSWESLGRVDVIKKWSGEVKAALDSSAGQDEWALIGKAITIIHPEVEDCRNILKRVAHDVGFNFICFEDLEVLDYFSQEQVSSPSEVPTIVYLEPGDWMKSVNDEATDKSGLITMVQNNICDMIKQFNPQQPVIYVTSTSDFNDFSVGFRKVGWFDRRFNILKPTLDELGKCFLSMVGENICGESFTKYPAKVGKLLDLEFDDKRRQELIALTLKRIAKRESRKLEFADLVYLSTQGSAEADEYPKRSVEFDKKIAVHEAGHAVVAMIDSEGKNIPEYVSILESENYNGVVADSMSYHLSKHKSRTYADIRHQIRVSLAGRVAEHLVYGSENISIASATDDLRKATELCFYMFSSRGVSNDMESLEGACSNLTIEREEDKPFNLKRTEAMARTYLAEQYKIVHETLVRNRILFNSIVDQLMTGAILDQRDLCRITRDITT